MLIQIFNWFSMFYWNWCLHTYILYTLYTIPTITIIFTSFSPTIKSVAQVTKVYSLSFFLGLCRLVAVVVVWFGLLGTRSHAYLSPNNKTASDIVESSGTSAQHAYMPNMSQRF